MGGSPLASHLHNSIRIVDLRLALLLGGIKTTPLWLYLSVAALALLQYIGENAIGFSHSLGIVVEELSEAVIYLLALGYLWSFKVAGFEERLERRLELKEVTH